MQFKNVAALARLAAFALVLSGLAGAAHASSADDEFEEYAKRIKTAEVMGPLGIDMFGDSVNYYNGALNFSATDIDIPGNSTLPVRIGRTHSTADTEELAVNGAFGDWELDLPYIKGTFSAAAGWQTNRCTGGLTPPNVVDGGFTWRGEMYWRGDTLYVPGAGSQGILQSSVLPKPANDAGLTKFQTSKFWLIRCQATLANAGTGGFQGEGFVAVAPDGTKYTFDWMTSRQVKPVVISNGTVTTGLSYRSLPRVEIRLYPTRVEDRFGNSVQYIWSGSQLTQIVSSDGRTIQLCYLSGRVAAAGVGAPAFNASCQATAPGRIWNYAYSGNQLATATLPDATAWNYGSSESGARTGLPGFKILYDANTSVPTSARANCNHPGQWLPNQSSTVVIDHPSGARGVFQLSPLRQGRTQVDNDCESGEVTWNPADWHNTGAPVQTDNFALTSKQITGPGLPTAQIWSVSYAMSGGCSLYTGCGVAPATETITATNPDGSSTRYTFGVRFRLDEGKLLSTEVISGGVLRRTDQTYATAPYPQRTGVGMLVADFPPIDDFADAYLLPVAHTHIVQGSDTYDTVVNSFDSLARPVGVTRSNSFSTDRRTEVTTWRDFLGRTAGGSTVEATWVLGQVAEKCVTSSAGTSVPDAAACHADSSQVIASSATFLDPTAQISTTSAFGQLTQTLTYNSDGTLGTVTDATNNQTKAPTWKRGVPTSIQFADGTSKSIVVDDNGWITSVTDESGNPIGYQYDSVGRLTLVTYPEGDPRSISYVQLPSAELGMPIGTWRARSVDGPVPQTNRGLQHSTYFDARLNPVLEEEKDLSSNVVKYKKREFDYLGRATYQSYPSLTSAATVGILSGFDALGRLTAKNVRRNGTAQESLEQDSYPSSHSKQVTDADGKSTTITYQAFDQPGYEGALQIAAPESQLTSIARDFLGKIAGVTQSGAGRSAARNFAYDTAQRLCRRDDPESGSTFYGYEAAGRVAWEYKGQPSGACTSAKATDATAFTYDPRGRVTLVDYPGVTDDVTSTYWPNGAIKTVANVTAAWSYTYTRRNLPDTEQVVIDGNTFLLDPSYDSMAHVSSATLPDGRSIAYGPDAWGRPTQIGSWASSIVYHPNDLPSTYSLGNGLGYKQLVDDRLRPINQQTGPDQAPIQKLAYGYTTAGDLTSIGDQVDGADNASMGYDGLHRLVTASGIWGSFGFSYDALNNITSRTGGSGSLTYGYNTTSNLLWSISGAQTRNYTYNARGEITGDGIRTLAPNNLGQVQEIPGVAVYKYDGNGKRIKTEQNGSVEYAIYGLGGSLVYTKLIPASSSSTPSPVVAPDPVALLCNYAGSLGCSPPPTLAAEVHRVSSTLCANAVIPSELCLIVATIAEISDACLRSSYSCTPKPAVLSMINTLTQHCATGGPECPVALVTGYYNALRQVLVLLGVCAPNDSHCIPIEDPEQNPVLLQIRNLAQACINGDEGCPANPGGAAPPIVDTDFLNLHGQLIVEVKTAAGVTNYNYMHTDLLGSPRKATYGEEDPHSGQLKWQEHYDPYGQKLNGVSDKIGYTGHAYDAESGFTYMQARFYDPLVGRFLSTDPISFSDQNPFSFNRYAYANNSPYKYTDPTGMCPAWLQSCTDGGLEGMEGTRSDGSRAGEILSENREAAARTEAFRKFVTESSAKNERVRVVPANGSAEHAGETARTISDTSGVGGAAAAVGEHAAGTSSIGSNFKLYTKPFYGSQYVRFTLGLAEVGRVAGGGLFVAGTIADAARVANGDIGVAHFGINSAMGLAAFDFPVGTAVSLGYFSVEATVGWEHVDLSRDVGAPQFVVP